MENVHDIANWFLSHESMTHKKLQKLCYYAQAWYCALYDGTPLFEDEIQAWIHGPVITSLYPKYADYRWMPIPKYESTSISINEDAVAVLDAVWDAYGEYSGDQLESLTHSEDPWKQARGDLKPWMECKNPISCVVMREYYGKKYEQAQND